MKFLLVPDKFKGSLSGPRFCEIASTLITEYFPTAEISAIPICDGGEGSVEILTELFFGKLLTMVVTDGNFLKRNATYGITDRLGIIGISNSSGLSSTMIKNPLQTTTVGLGEQIRMAKTMGKREVLICLGGSSTNDGGAGAMSALGAKFFKRSGQEFVPTGGTLKEIHSIRPEGMYDALKGMSFTGLCDVKNPLLGENGCSRIYSPQKGANRAEVEFLEENMRHFAEKTAFLGVSPEVPGSGAAGGLGYFVKAALKGNLISGAEYCVKHMKIENEMLDADYIFTGEGKFDRTSFSGKLISELYRLARAVGKTLTVFCGENEMSCEELSEGLCVIAVNDPDATVEENKAYTAQLLTEHMASFLQERARIKV